MNTDRHTSGFYTDDVTRLRLGTIWRMAWRTSAVLAVPLFLFLGLRKLLGWRFRASYGVRRPESVDPVPVEAVPPEVLQAFALGLRACHEAGFQPPMYFHPHAIGGKQVYSAALLDKTGIVCCKLLWTRLALANQENVQTQTSCGSLLEDGTEVLTAPFSAADGIAERMPPYTDILRLPPDTPPRDIIAAHCRRMQEYDGVRSFDRESLLTYSLESAQRYFDFLVEKGVYVPLTPKEVQRLTAR